MMPTADLYLRKNKTKAVGNLDLATGRGKATDIALRPNWASAVLGGGAGNNSDGDVVMKEQSGEERIHLDAGGGGPVSGSTDLYATGRELPTPRGPDPRGKHAVTIEGGRGQLTLGDDGADGELNLFGSRGDSRGPIETVTAYGSDGSLYLGGGGGYERQQIGVNGTVGVVNARWQTACELDASDATLSLGTEGYRGSSSGAVSGAIEVNHESGETTAEVRGDAGSVVAGGKNTEGSVLLKHTDANGNTVQYLAEATQQGLEISTMQRTSGSNPSIQNNTAMRIDPDGTVRVKGGTVKPL